MKKNEIKRNYNNVKNCNERYNNCIKQNNNAKTYINKNNVIYTKKSNINVTKQTGCLDFLSKKFMSAQNSLKNNFNNIKEFLSQTINDNDNEFLLLNNLM